MPFSTCSSRAVGWLLVALSAGFATGVRAQVCEDDAGALCDDDGGAAGQDAAVGAAPGGDDDAGATGAACSCTTDDNESGQGRVHLCTGSSEADICATLDCDRGTFRGSPCSTRAARLCCSMPSRGLYTQLYDDCAHPNCEAGFLAQCRDFAGEVSEGACEVGSGSFDASDHDDPDEDEGGFCSVSRVGGGDGQRGVGLWLGLLGGLLVARARRRARSHLTALIS
jgi:hypothetical protein